MASIRKKGAGYEVRYRDPSGKSRGKSFRKMEDARRFANSIESSKETGAWVDPKLGRTRFEPFATEWFASQLHLKPSTRDSYEVLLRKHVLPAFGSAPLSSIQRTHVQKFMGHLSKQGASASTIRNVFRLLSRILGEAHRSRYIAHNPAAGIPAPKPTRKPMHFLTPEQIRDLADAIEPRYAALVLTAGFTGLRWGECAGLKISAVDLIAGKVEVRSTLSEVRGVMHEVPPKTYANRTIHLPKFLAQTLASHLAEFPSETGLVFTSAEGTPLRKHFLRRHFRPALRRAGLDEAVRFHDLRHSAASIAISLGASVKAVQEMLGHSSATVTLDTYSHVLPGLAEQLAEGMDAAFEKAGSRRVGNPWEIEGQRTPVRFDRKAR